VRTEPPSLTITANATPVPESIICRKLGLFAIDYVLEKLKRRRKYPYSGFEYSSQNVRMTAFRFGQFAVDRHSASELPEVELLGPVQQFLNEHDGSFSLFFAQSHEIRSIHGLVQHGQNFGFRHSL
jgi:hypothetical protein